MDKKDEVLDFFDELEAEDEKLKSYISLYESLASFMVDFNILKQSKKITQKEIANKMGTTQSAVSRIESLRTNPSYKQLVKMSNAVGGKLLITPMADMTVQIPLDLQKTVQKISELNKVSVEEYILNLLRYHIENDYLVYSCNTQNMDALGLEGFYKDVYEKKIFDSDSESNLFELAA